MPFCSVERLKKHRDELNLSSFEQSFSLSRLRLPTCMRSLGGWSIDIFDCINRWVLKCSNVQKIASFVRVAVVFLGSPVVVPGL